MTLSSVREYISLTFTAWIRREPPNATFYGGHANIRWWIVLSLLTWINSLRIQLKKKSSTFEKLNGSQIDAEKFDGTHIYFLATFSLPTSSLLKFSIKAMVFQELMLYVLLVLMNRILVKLMLSRGIIKSLKYGTSASVKRSKSGTTTSGCFLKKKRKKHWFIMRKFCINGS